ncbi:RNA-directed DNA polymerase (Reverse transcriptase), partial [Trifolium medium]|nr:RNA-directed DNA polymerase (Reverse transcriptase) [Trifolium medium]
MEEDCDMLFKPESVIATRMKDQGGQQVQQVLIKWTNRTIDEATWEDMMTVKNQFPEYNLEDKVAFLGG